MAVGLPYALADPEEWDSAGCVLADIELVAAWAKVMNADRFDLI
jgi:catalase (peroxidase I)